MSLAQLQGTWRVVSLEIDGAPIPSAAFHQARVEVAGSRFVSHGMGAEYSGEVSVDDAASPARFTLMFLTGPEAGRANHGIYEIDADRWRLCLQMSGGAAPQAFATAPGSGCALQTLERTA
jgi:uncharacterized protein (TIGR03067 family)